MAWDKLYRSKTQGVIKFRNVDGFNTDKKVWRLITVLDSFFAKGFKGKYYRKRNPLNLIKSYSPSYEWKSYFISISS